MKAFTRNGIFDFNTLLHNTKSYYGIEGQSNNDKDVHMANL